MGIMSPAFREINFSRIETLAKSKKLSDATIASIICDETGKSVSTQDVSGYRKLTHLASEQMLVSKEIMRTITGDEGSDPDLQPA